MKHVLKTHSKVLNSLGSIVKTGHNSYSHYDHHTLSDLVPEIQKACFEHGATYTITIEHDEAILRFYDLESAEFLEFKTPFIYHNSVRNATEIQNMGAALTYYRRYLMLMAFNITEPCDVDNQKPEPKEEIALNLSAPAVKKEVSAEDIAKAIQSLDKASSVDDLRKLFASLDPVMKEHQEVKDFGNAKRSQLLNVKQASETKVSINPSHLIKQSQI